MQVKAYLLLYRTCVSQQKIKPIPPKKIDNIFLWSKLISIETMP